MIAPTPSTNWRMVTLDDVAAPVKNAIVDGPFGSNLKLVDYVPEGVPVLQGKNITDDTFRWFDVRFISSRKAEELKRSSVRIGDILIVKIGSIGYSAILDDLNGFDHAIIPANLAKVTPNLCKVDLRYLHRWLTSTAANDYLVRVASKTAQPALSLRKIKELPVPLPPLPEQKRIARILDAADALRAKRREAFAQLDTLLQSTFLDMFGDPVTNPMGWEVTAVSTIGSIQGGLQVTSKRRSLPIERPYLRVANVFRGFLQLDEIKTIRLTESELLRTSLDYEDLLIVEGHGNRAEIGRCARWDGSIDQCVHQNHLIRLRCDRSKTSPIYVEYFINSPGGRRSLVGTSRTTSGLNTISVSKVGSSEIQLPSLDLQHRFAAVVESVERQKARQHAHLAELDTLFASLQSRAFRGEL